LLAIARQTGRADMLTELCARLRHSGRLTPRQLAWLLATAMPPADVVQLPGIAAEFGVGVESPAEASSLGALLTASATPAAATSAMIAGSTASAGTGAAEMPFLGQHAAGRLQVGRAHRSDRHRQAHLRPRR